MVILDKIQNRFRGSQLLMGTAWTVLGSGLSRIALIVGSILSANILGVEQYGQFGITRSTVNVILTIAGLNIGTVLTKYISEYRDKDPAKCAKMVTQNYLFVFSLTAVLASIVYLFADGISISLLKSPHLANEIKLSVFILFFGIIFPLNESIYRGFEWFKQLGFIQILGSISFIVLVPLGSYLYQVYGAICGYLAYTIVMTVLTTFNLRNLLTLHNFSLLDLRFNRLDFSELKRLTIPVLLASLVEAPFFWLAQIILIKSAGMAENGIVSAILQIRTLILIVPGYVSLVTLPLLSNALSSANTEKYKSYLNKSLWVNFVISIICLLPLLIFPNFFIRLFGEGFQATYMTSFLAYISVPFLVLSGVFNQSLIAKGKGWVNLYISLAWNLIFLTAVYYFVTYSNMGSLGYMIGLLIGIVMQALLRFIYNKI